MDTDKHGTFAALAVPNFRRYVAGQSLSLIGTWVETVAQALLVLRLTHSGTILGLTTAARYAPILLLSPYAGLVVDRHSKRHVLIVTQAGLALVSATLGVSVLTGNIRLWQVVVLALLFGTLSAVDNPARQAFVPEWVRRRTSSPWATVSTQVPIRLSDCPATYRRKFGTARAANVSCCFASIPPCHPRARRPVG